MLMAILYLLLLGEPFPGYAQHTWWQSNSKIRWDAVTEYSDGTPLPSGSIVQYRIYEVGSADPKTAAVDKGVVSLTEATVLLTTEGWYFYGVSAERMIDGAVASASSVSWSDNPDVCLADTFGFEMFQPIAAPKNLRGVE